MPATWKVYPGGTVLEMAVGGQLCRWWALHGTNQIEVACQTNGVYDHVGIGRELYGFYRLGGDLPSFPTGVASETITGGSITALLFPLTSGAITWLVTNNNGQFDYQIAGWPMGEAPNIQNGTF